MKTYVFTATQTVTAESEEEAREIFANEHAAFVDWECEEVETTIIKRIPYTPSRGGL